MATGEVRELIDKLASNARFYRNESVALAEKPERRDNRHLGAQEAWTISELLYEAAKALEGENHEQAPGPR